MSDTLSNLSKCIIKNYSSRLSNKDKEEFRTKINTEFKKLDFAKYQLNSSPSKNENLIFGTPKTASIIFTAHYDTATKQPFFIPKTFYTYSIMLLVFVLLLLVFYGLAFLMNWNISTIPVLALISFICIAVCPQLLNIFLKNAAYKKSKDNYNDNTSGVLTLIEIADKLPKEIHKKVAFIFFDNEEKGLKGSKEFVKQENIFNKQAVILNFDCVGRGNLLRIYVPKASDENKYQKNKLNHCIRNHLKNDMQYEYTSSKILEPNSDNKSFTKKNKSICCLSIVFLEQCGKPEKPIYCLKNIHTNKDIMDKNIKHRNILFLKDTIIEYIPFLLNTTPSKNDTTTI